MHLRLLKRRPGSHVTSPDGLLGLPRQRPFVPFRLLTTDGRTHDVRHPDQALVLRTRATLPQPGEADQVAERSEHLALIHTVRAVEREPGTTASAAAAG